MARDCTTGPGSPTWDERRRSGYSDDMHDDEKDNPELEEIVEEAADEAEAHGVSRQEAEKLEGGKDADPQDGAAM